MIANQPGGIASLQTAQQGPTLEEQILSTWGKYGQWEPGRAKEFADLLRANGITDLSAFKGAKVVETPFTETRYQGGNPETGDLGEAYEYTGARRQLQLGDKKLGFLGDIGRGGEFEGKQSEFLQDVYTPGIDRVGWSSQRKGNVSYYGFTDPRTDEYVIAPQWDSSSDADTGRELFKGALMVGGMMTGLGAIPAASGLGMGITAANALNSAYYGDYGKAILGLAGMGGGMIPAEYASTFNNLRNAAGAANAAYQLSQGNESAIFDLVSSGMNLAGLQDLKVGDYNLNQKDISNLKGLTSAVANKDAGDFLVALGNLSGSENAEIAGKFTNLYENIKDGKVGNLLGDIAGINKSLAGTGPTTGSATGGARSMSSSSGYTGDATAVGYDPEYYSNSDTTDYEALYNEPSYRPVEWYDDPIQQIERASPGDYGTQDLGIAPKDQTSDFYSGGGGNTGFASTWQTVGSDRIMVNDDGTAIGINTETNETYSLTPDEVQQMIDNKMLNTSTSGYTAATTGKTGTQQQNKTGTQQQSKTNTQQPKDDLGIGFDPKLFAMLGAMFARDDEDKTPYQVADIDVESPFGRYV